MVLVSHCQREHFAATVDLDTEEYIVITVRHTNIAFENRQLQNICSSSILDITRCQLPFIDDQNRTQVSCITTADYFNGTIPWCKNALGQRQNCSSIISLLR